MPTPTPLIPLPLLPRELAVVSGGNPPGYRKVHGAAVDGLFPAERIGARWFVKRADLPTIAAALGLEFVRPWPAAVSAERSAA